MSSGLLTVAYDYAAPRQLIRSGENGFLAPFDEEQAFLVQCGAAAHAWKDTTQRHAAREAAHHLGWQRVIEQFENELISVIGTTSSQDPT